MSTSRPAPRTRSGVVPGRTGPAVRRGVVAALLASVVAASLSTAAAMPTRPATVATSAATWVLPVAGAHVLRAFDAPPAPWAAGHRGVDLTATTGGPVAAPADGVVAFAGPVAGRRVLTIRHAAGLTTSLEPVRADVTVGTHVRAGAPVGTVESGPHCGGTPCVHWGVRTAPDSYLDPMLLIDPGGPVVLLPVG